MHNHEVLATLRKVATESEKATQTSTRARAPSLCLGALAKDHPPMAPQTKRLAVC